MSMKLDYLPTDVCPTIKDACGEVRLVGRKADVDFLRPDDGFGSLADLLGKFSLMSASVWKAVIRQADF